MYRITITLLLSFVLLFSAAFSYNFVGNNEWSDGTFSKYVSYDAPEIKCDGDKIYQFWYYNDAKFDRVLYLSQEFSFFRVFSTKYECEFEFEIQQTKDCTFEPVDNSNYCCGGKCFNKEFDVTYNLSFSDEKYWVFTVNGVKYFDPEQSSRYDMFQVMENDVTRYDYNPNYWTSLNNIINVPLSSSSSHLSISLFVLFAILLTFSF